MEIKVNLSVKTEYTYIHSISLFCRFSSVWISSSVNRISSDQQAVNFHAQLWLSWTSSGSWIINICFILLDLLLSYWFSKVPWMTLYWIRALLSWKNDSEYSSVWVWYEQIKVAQAVLWTFDQASSEPYGSVAVNNSAPAFSTKWKHLE